MKINNNSCLSLLKKNALSLLITIIALFLAIAHLVVPGFKMDTIGLTLIGIAFIPWLLPYMPRYFESGKIGSLEIKFRDLENKIADQENQMEKLKTISVLRELKYDLGAFIPDEIIGQIQENRRQVGLRQNPLLVYVEPAVQNLLGIPYALNKISHTKISNLTSDPERQVKDIVKVIEEMIKNIS